MPPSVLGGRIHFCIAAGRKVRRWVVPQAVGCFANDSFVGPALGCRRLCWEDVSIPIAAIAARTQGPALRWVVPQAVGCFANDSFVGPALVAVPSSVLGGRIHSYCRYRGTDARSGPTVGCPASGWLLRKRLFCRAGARRRAVVCVGRTYPFLLPLSRRGRNHLRHPLRQGCEGEEGYDGQEVRPYGGLSRKPVGCFANDSFVGPALVAVPPYGLGGRIHLYCRYRGADTRSGPTFGCLANDSFVGPALLRGVAWSGGRGGSVGEKA